MRFPEKVTRLIETKGLSDRKVARAVGGISATTIGRWKVGDSVPRFDEARRLAELLGVTLDYLANDSLDAPEPGLTEVQRRVLWAAEQVGYDLAIRRIMNAPDVRPLGKTWGEYLAEQNNETAS